MSLFHTYSTFCVKRIKAGLTVVALPSRLATTESKPVPAPISSTALSIRFTCCWLLSKNWHKATACRTNSHGHISNNRVSECTVTHHRCRAYPRPDQGTVSVYRLANVDLMTSKTKRLLSQCVVNTRLPDVSPVQSLSGHHSLVRECCRAGGGRLQLCRATLQKSESLLSNAEMRLVRVIFSLEQN